MACSTQVSSQTSFYDSDSDDNLKVMVMLLMIMKMLLKGLLMNWNVLVKDHSKLKKMKRDVNGKLAAVEHELKETTIKFIEMCDVASKTVTSYQNLMSENNDVLVLIFELETKISNLKIDLKKSNVNGDSLDTTILETKLLELDEANEKVSTLEVKVSNMVDFFPRERQAH